MRRTILVIASMVIACNNEPAKVSEGPPSDPTFAIPAGRINRSVVCFNGPDETFDEAYPAGRIDRRTVTCREYRACVAARKCPPTNCPEWEEFYAEFKPAVAYCAWKGGTVPLYGQWARAVLGADGKNNPPFTDVADSCWVPTSKRIDGGYSITYPRCEFMTLEGVTYWTRGDGEWTRSPSCDGVVVANSFDHNIRRFTPQRPELPSTPEHEFRCFYEDVAK